MPATRDATDEALLADLLTRLDQLMDHGVTTLEAKSGYLNSGFSTNQLFTSLLRAFGGDDAGFGYSDETTPTGDLPGLLDG